MPRDETGRPTVLIMGGTGEARELAQALDTRLGGAIRLVSSLAGRLEEDPGRVAVELPGEVRIGGYGGDEGLAAFIAEDGVDLVIDATHPFAARISGNVRVACERTRTPRLSLIRPCWEKTDADTWFEVDSPAEAAALLPGLGRRPFLTVGTSMMMAFSGVDGCTFLVRQITGEGESPPLPDYRRVLGRGPFTVESERELMEAHGVDLLITKASGGPATEAKILAARELGLPVLRIRRPPEEPGPKARTVADAVDWVAGELDL